MTRDEFYKLTDILNSEVLGNFMHGGEADELIAMFEEAVEHSNILEQEEPVSDDLEETAEKYSVSNIDGYDKEALYTGYIAGAQWQKQQDSIPTKDLGELISTLSRRYPEVSFAKLSRIAVRVAKWQKEHLWKPADGDDLPEYDREVIVFTQDFPNDAGIMSVAIGHRPNPEGFDGKSITTGQVEHYTPKIYDKGGWNIPDAKYWLDVELPKEIEL